MKARTERNNLGRGLLPLVICLIGVFFSAGCITLERHFVPQETELPGGIVTVPVVLKNGLPFVEATINGRGPYTLLLDTGCGILSLSDRIADDLNLRNTRHRTTAITAGGATVAASRVVAVEELRLGTAVFRKFNSEVENLAAR